MSLALIITSYASCYNQVVDGSRDKMQKGGRWRARYVQEVGQIYSSKEDFEKVYALLDFPALGGGI